MGEQAAAQQADGKRPRRIGKYEVFDAFATGGMASIHVGRLSGPAGFTKLVVVKQIHPKFARSELHAKMLLEEARLAARIRSPYVVDIHEAIREGDQLCVVMELVRGVSLDLLLAALIAKKGRVKPAVAAAIVSDALRGLHAAHIATDATGRPLNIIHRDVSPHNVMVGSDGVTRVLDFGIAKGRDSEELTHTGEVKGKVGYMPPEQLTSKVITRQVDVYAAGVVLWEALVGARFRNDGDASVLKEILQSAAKSPRELVPSISEALADVVMTAIDREPARRFATAEAMAIALEEACTPASRDEVGRFVEEVGYESLETMDAIMRACETANGPSSSRTGVVATTPPAASSAALPELPAAATATIVMATFPEPLAEGDVEAATVQAASVPNKPLREPATISRHRLLTAGAAVLLLATTILVMTRSARPREDGAIPEARAESPLHDRPNAPPPPAPTSSRVDSAPSPPPVASVASAVSTPSASVSTAPALPRSTSVGGRPRVDRPRGNCTPPFEYDAQGRKHYKRECLP